MQKHGTVVNCDVVHLYSRNHKNFILQDHYTLLDKCGIRQDRVSCDARLSHSLHTFSAPLNWVSQRALSLYFVFCILYFTLSILYSTSNILYFAFCFHIQYLIFCISHSVLRILYLYITPHFFSATQLGLAACAIFPQDQSSQPSATPNTKIQKYKNTNSMAYWPEIPPL